MKRNKNKLKYGSTEVGENPFDPKRTKIKITAWFDADVILALRSRAECDGTKYQTLMNHLLRQSLSTHPSLEQRVEKLEKAIKTRIG
jgi:uncharacterized protein (DUF4415 family)